MNHPPTINPPPPLSGTERDILLTLFDLGRKVASVIDLDELLPRIPELVRRLVPFDAFGVYFVGENRQHLTLAYSVGYPEAAADLTMSATEGVLGRVVSTQQPVVIGDVSADPEYVSIVPAVQSTLAVPLLHKSTSIGALNVLSRDRDRYSERDVAILLSTLGCSLSSVMTPRPSRRWPKLAERWLRCSISTNSWPGSRSWPLDSSTTARSASC
jgi:putative methionine-R-sulfoxide reductase with GAF domain